MSLLILFSSSFKVRLHSSHSGEKGFVKDGIWIELFNNINKALKEIEGDYDFGPHAPMIPEFRIFDSWSSSKEVQHFSMNRYDELKLPRIYSVIDTESGVYFYYCSTGEREAFEVESLKVEGNHITVVINEGNYIPYNGTDKSVYTVLLIRGIKPGETKNYSFQVLISRVRNLRGLGINYTSGSHMTYYLFLIHK